MWYTCVAQTQEWTTRQKNELGQAVIGVKENTTEEEKGAVFVLSQEEELASGYQSSCQYPKDVFKQNARIYFVLVFFFCQQWFDIYFTRVRPQLLKSKKRKRNDAESEERFFISTTGRPIYNVSNDLSRLHLK